MPTCYFSFINDIKRLQKYNWLLFDNLSQICRRYIDYMCFVHHKILDVVHFLW